MTDHVFTLVNFVHLKFFKNKGHFGSQNITFVSRLVPFSNLLCSCQPGHAI